MTEFGRRLSSIRKAKDITQEQLGTSLGISRQAVGHWESGRSVPDLETIRRVANALGCQVEDLVLYPGAKFKPTSRKTKSAPEPPLPDPIEPAPEEVEPPSPEPPEAPPQESALVPEEETPPPPPEPPRKKPFRPILLALIAGILIGGLVGGLVVQRAFSPSSAPSPQPTAAPKAQLLVAPVKSAVAPEDSDIVASGKGYLFDFVVSNESNVSFSVRSVALLYYNEANERCASHTLPTAELSKHFGGEMLTRSSIPVHMPLAVSQLDYAYAICQVEGVDANGNELTFEGRVNFLPEASTAE